MTRPVDWFNKMFQLALKPRLLLKLSNGRCQTTGGLKTKDTVSAIVFIRKIDDLARTNNWNDTTAYANVANTVKGFIRDWLFATVEMLDWEVDQLTWTNLKPRFQQQFATQSDDKLIIDGLSNLAMKLNELTGELLARITNTMVIIKESYAAYKNKIEALQHDANRGYLDVTATKWKNDSVNNVMQFFKMQLFWAALPGDICKVVAQHDQNSITLDCTKLQLYLPERSWFQAHKNSRSHQRGKQLLHRGGQRGDCRFPKPEKQEIQQEQS
jgi:hypothetical protein